VFRVNELTNRNRERKRAITAKDMRRRLTQESRKKDLIEGAGLAYGGEVLRE